MGENMKFEMVMVLVDVAPAPLAPRRWSEVAPLPEPDGLEPPPLQAARSSAPPRTRTSAPPLHRSYRFPHHAQTAWEVGLNARGVPEEVCAPGYIPST